MTTTTDCGTVQQLIINTDFFDGFTHQYDLVAIQSDYIADMEVAAQEIAPSLRLARNGRAFCDAEDVDKFRSIDWHEIDESVNFEIIMSRNEIG